MATHESPPSCDTYKTLPAFELSNELKRLSMVESQFREDFTSLRKQVQNLATGLIDHARTSYELEILLNHNPDGRPWKPGGESTSNLIHWLQQNQMTLERPREQTFNSEYVIPFIPTAIILAHARTRMCALT